MEWVLRIMANLLRPDELGPAEAAYQAVAQLARVIPEPAAATYSTPAIGTGGGCVSLMGVWLVAAALEGAGRAAPTGSGPVQLAGGLPAVKADHDGRRLRRGLAALVRLRIGTLVPLPVHVGPFVVRASTSQVPFCTPRALQRSFFP